MTEAEARKDFGDDLPNPMCNADWKARCAKLVDVDQEPPPARVGSQAADGRGDRVLSLEGPARLLEMSEGISRGLEARIIVNLWRFPHLDQSSVVP